MEFSIRELKNEPGTFQFTRDVSRQSRYTLGLGILTWARFERQTDRYGAVFLMQDGHTSFTREPSPSVIHAPTVLEAVGMLGTLTAEVIEPRISTHAGDERNNIVPCTPKKDEVITLGTGVLFFTLAPDGGVCVGVGPVDGRLTQWMDIRALYDAHEQWVRLVFTPHQTDK